MIEKAEENADVRAETDLFDCWYGASELIERVGEYDMDRITVLNSDSNVVYDGEAQSMDAVHDQVGLTERKIDSGEYKLWTKKLPVTRLDEQKVVITGKVIEDEDEDNPVKCKVTNKIDAPSAHIIGSYGFRWRIETFWMDSNQNLGFGDCEDEGSTTARRHSHMVRLAHSLLSLGPAESADTSVQTTPTSIRIEWGLSLREAIFSSRPKPVQDSL